MFIETHAHLDFTEFDIDRTEVIERATAANVEKIITIGCSISRAKKTLPIAKNNENIWASVGIHPSEKLETNTIEEAMKELESMITSSEKIVAIGECGFDFYREKSDQTKIYQKELFLSQVSLAKKYNLPLIIHSREAEEETWEAIVSENITNAVVHCYTSSQEFAEKLWDRGILTSFTGILCFPPAQNVKDVFLKCPLELTMIETDCPFLAPPPYRGKRCEPMYIPIIAEEMAKIKNISVSDIEEQTTKNAEKFFGI